MIVGILILFLLPLAVRAALYAGTDRPAGFDDADCSSVGMLPPADAERDARFLVFTGRTGRWKGIFAIHSWIVFKPENATSWSRYDVVEWDQPVRTNGWAPDGRWFGDTPRVLVDVRGPAAAALIPKVKAAIATYGYSHSGDYRIWPGPNCNTFTATVLRAVPELETTLPSNAVGKDFRAYPYVGLTDSGTGVEASLWGLLSIKLGWVEGVEINVLGLVAGLDLRHPAVKLPGFGRVGVDDGTAVAAPARQVTGDSSEAGKSKHGDYDAREYPINETGHLDSSQLANAGRFGRSYQHSPLEHLERRVGASNKRCAAPVIRSRTETKIRNRQIKRLA